MSLTKTRAWVAGTIVVCLLLTVAAWFLLISPRRAEAATLREQTVAVQDANERTRLEIAQLKAEYAKLAQHQADLVALQVALPLDDKENEMIRKLEAAAAASDIMLDSVTATPPAVPAVAAAPAPATPAADGTTPTPAPVADPVTGVVEIPVTIVVTGDYHGSLEFLRQLQTSVGRDYLVWGMEIKEAELDPNADEAYARTHGWVTMTIRGSMFALPESAIVPAAPAEAAAAPAAPTNND